MAELVSVVSLTIGVLSFLNLCKGAIASIYKDVERFTHHGSTIWEFRCRFVLFATQIRVWRQFWKLDSGLGESFWESLWGYDYGDIEVELSLIQARSRAIWREIARRLGPLAQPERSERRQARRQNRNRTFWKRLCDSLFRIELFNERLLEIERGIDRLEQHSRRLFSLQHELVNRVSVDQDLAIAVDEIFTENYCMLVALDSRPYSEALYHAFSREREYCRFDLALERLFGTLRSNQSPTIMAGAHNVTYDIACYTIHNYQNFVITAYTPSVAHQHFESRTEDCTCATDGNQQLRLACGSVTDDPENSSQVTFVRHQHLETSDGPDISNDAATRLRALLKDQRNGFIKELHGDVTRIERAILSFQLASFTFLLLHTGWTSQICSCAVSFTFERQIRRYRVCLGREARHLDPVSLTYRQSGNPRQWCEKLGDKPIQRLGLLLTEIAIGATIYDVAISQGVLEVDFEHFLDSETRPRPSYIQNIKSRVEQAAGTMYAEVVNWCLNPRLSDSSVDEALSIFYCKALRPLYEQYMKISQRPNVLERTRRLQEQGNQ